GLNSIF
ncbi:3-dehydroquinate synthase, partial [Vibrio cholerae O1 str. EDC-022]